MQGKKGALAGRLFAFFFLQTLMTKHLFTLISLPFRPVATLATLRSPSSSLLADVFPPSSIVRYLQYCIFLVAQLAECKTSISFLPNIKWGGAIFFPPVIQNNDVLMRVS